MAFLTAKQEQFALNLFKGLSQRDAYIAAGYSKKQLDETIDVHACALANNDKVMTRLAELRDNAAGDTIATEKERREKLTEILRKSDAEVNVIRAIAEHNKMDGSYAPEQKSIQGEITIKVVYGEAPDGEDNEGKGG